MSKIAKIHARQILDSRDTPTISCEVTLEDGSQGSSAVPSGASRGKFEAFELRDGDPSEYNGKSVHKAINNIHNLIAPKIIGMNALAQSELDRTLIDLDGTINKSNLGANAILAVSLAVCTAAAKAEKLELYEYLNKLSPNPSDQLVLPYAMFNIINGGVHAVNSADFQEYMIIPKQKQFSERLECASEIFQALKVILTKKGLPLTVGDEGGFAPPVNSNTEGLDLIMEAIVSAGFKPGENVFLGLDLAASQFYKDGKYHLTKDGKSLSPEDMIGFCEQLTKDYPIISLEDPLEEEGFDSWSQLNNRIGGKVQIVGDDLYVTNKEKLQQGIAHKSSNAILIKLNQIGTLTETIETIALAYQNQFKAIISHRSGETEDTFIADLAVAMKTGQIKTGSLSRSERTAKYNRLLAIEEKLKPYV